MRGDLAQLRLLQTGLTCFSSARRLLPPSFLLTPPLPSLLAFDLPRQASGNAESSRLTSRRKVADFGPRKTKSDAMGESSPHAKSTLRLFGEEAQDARGGGGALLSESRLPFKNPDSQFGRRTCEDNVDASAWGARCESPLAVRSGGGKLVFVARVDAFPRRAVRTLRANQGFIVSSDYDLYTTQ